jgi:hypothetical protein
MTSFELRQQSYSTESARGLRGPRVFVAIHHLTEGFVPFVRIALYRRHWRRSDDVVLWYDRRRQQ